MQEKIIDIKDVQITLIRSQRARSLNITIKPFKGVRVSVPVSVSFKKAEEVTGKSIDWIKSHLSKIQKAELLFTFFELDTKFQTRSHHLELKVSENEKLRSVVKNNKISVTIPESDKINDAEVQNEIRKAIELAWRNEAKEYLPERVKELADRKSVV